MVVLFDLDGVLVDTKEIHYYALNSVLPEKYRITMEEEYSIFDGLTTHQKLEKLTELKKLPYMLHDKMWQYKQQASLESLKVIGEKKEKIELFKYLKDQGYGVGICSNSIRPTTETLIENIGVKPYVDCIFSGDDVYNKKPHPQMYWNAMSWFSVLPKDIIIYEDSIRGYSAAKSSGAKHIVLVTDVDDVNLDNFKKHEKIYCTN